MRVARKEDVSTGGLDNQGTGTDAVKGGKAVPLADGIGKTVGQPFAEKLFGTLISEIRGNLETLQTKVDHASAALLEHPNNQVMLDSYKEAVSHMLAFIIANSVKIRRAQSLKRGKDGKPKEFVRVDVVNEKLDALSKEFLKSQKPVLDLVSRLDEIRGLLVDFYDWPRGS